MIIFRLCKSKFSNDLSGKGAEINGGRWNNEGKAMVYTSISRALCVIEICVHTPLGNIPQDYMLISIEIPESIKVQELDINELPKNWQSISESDSSRNIGDQFINENRFLLMKVPSAVVPGEFNYLINPRHKDAGKIKIIKVEPFNFDERIFKR